jgi:hypothetical protein
MFRSLVLSACVIIGVSASATQRSAIDLVTGVATRMVRVQPMYRWLVGDTANYSMTIASMPGTMVMKITQVNGAEVTIDQNVDLGAMGKEDVVEVINSQTGQVISVTANGQKQTPPDPNDMQITSEDIGKITVPAGTFSCQDVKYHMKSENTDGEMWVDMNDIPVGGLLKMTTTQQGMPIEVDLTSFSHGS